MNTKMNLLKSRFEWVVKDVEMLEKHENDTETTDILEMMEEDIEKVQDMLKKILKLRKEMKGSNENE